LAPGAVPLANMAPALVTHAAHLRGLVGSSGGRRIIGANAQILFNLLVHGMSPQAAVSAPRVDFSGWPVIADARIPSEVLKQVSERLSVPVNPVRARLGGSTFASPVIIWGEPGRWKSGLDPMVDAAGEAVPASL
jgi:gamma-glutamyltranspeptidase/glutathione hydrolase